MSKTIKIQYMMMVEIICALGLLGLVTTCFYMTVIGMKKAEANFVRENRAIIVLDNTLERVTVLKHRTAAKINAVFDDEYSKSSLYTNKSISPKCEISGKSINISFRDTRDREVAEITINTD